MVVGIRYVRRGQLQSVHTLLREFATSLGYFSFEKLLLLLHKLFNFR